MNTRMDLRKAIDNRINQEYNLTLWHTKQTTRRKVIIQDLGIPEAIRPYEITLYYHPENQYRQKCVSPRFQGERSNRIPWPCP